MVAIPALNEENRVAACLKALLVQQDRRGDAIGAAHLTVAVLANNCTDATAAVARRIAATCEGRPDRPRILVREASFAPEDAHAGHARRAALDWADSLLADAPDGVLCTTDADSTAAPDWIARIWGELARGADAVAGMVDFDPAEIALLMLPEARRLEAVYSGLQAAVVAAIDPEPHDPWPNHVWAWGANLAVTRTAYRAVGGLPRVRLAEDRALVALLRRRDFRVRHSLDVRVRTSCRTLGRAPGGLADLIATYCTSDDYPCDAELMPIAVTAERARCKRELRAVFGRPATTAAADRLGVTRDLLAEILAQPCFGEAWEMIEGASTRYYHARLRPQDLPAEIAGATALLDALKRRGADRGDNRRAATAGLWTATASPP